MNKTVLAILAMSMLAVPLMPSATADPCTVPSNDSAGYPTCEAKLSTGPGGVTLFKSLGLGVGVCFVDPTFPAAPCAPNPGGVSSLGATFFFVDDHAQSVGNWNTHPDNGATDVGREVRVWVEWLQGVDGGGFEATACTDGDDDDVCSSDNPLDAQVSAVAWDDPDCTGKDPKVCNSGDETEVTFCAMKDNYDYVLVDVDTGAVTNEHDGDFDDVVVFIGLWKDESAVSDDNSGSGTSAGDFQVFAEYGAFLGETDCNTLNS